MSTPETLCSGCGATVTPKFGMLRDSSGGSYCSESTDGLHTLSLPPVAIAPEPQHTPLEKEMLAALKAIHAQLECPARNTTRGNRYREGVLISSDVRQQIKAAISRAEGGKQ